MNKPFLVRGMCEKQGETGGASLEGNSGKQRQLFMAYALTPRQGKAQEVVKLEANTFFMRKKNERATI